MNNSSQNNDNVLKSTKLEEITNVNKEYSQIQNDELELEDYLHTNVFNFIDGKEGIKDIFAIQNNALKIIDQLDRYGLALDRTVPLLEFRHITKFYEGLKVPVLVNVSFKLYPGDFHVVVGTNGSGKSTLVDCLLNQTEYKGEILVANKFTSNNDEWKKLVGVVPEMINFEPSKSVHDLLLDASAEKGISEIHAQSLIRNFLNQLNIKHLRNKRAIYLSLLERKKVALAMALLTEPHIVVLDEPLSGLQQHEQVDYLVLLAKLQQQNRGILVLSHLIDEFSGYANLITILSKGKVYYSGLIENLELHNLYKFTLSTSDNQIALNLLKKINCKYFYNDVANNIFVKFDNQFSLLLFQKELVNRNVVLHDLRHAATSLEDLYSILIKVGTAEAIQEINNFKIKGSHLKLSNN